MLEFKSVSKNFGSVQALKDISFSIDQGEFVFITGPSGAGKTTILRLLIREAIPSSGEIIFDSMKVHSLKKKEVPKLRQNIGSVFQDYRLLPGRTIGENIEVALAVKGVKRNEWKGRVEQVLKLVGLSGKSDFFPSQLSGGELQRVALARALVVNPKLIFADEPTGNLDSKTADGIMDLLLKINEEGKTILVATHNKEILEKNKKRVIQLEEGKVISDSKVKKNEKPHID
jgi:cell division transport system ATP-binding protein